MTADRWKMIKWLFQRGLDVPPAEWPAYLDTVCAGDASLRREVASLLAEHDPSATEIFQRHEISALASESTRTTAEDEPAKGGPIPTGHGDAAKGGERER